MTTKRFVLTMMLSGLLVSGEDTPRAKVGVALSGGSALGLAHIGVLEWMAEHRVPVDYIAGTSMGSVVGALYATGRTPAEIREFVERIDWAAVLAPDVTYRQLAYRRKEDKREYPSTIEFGVKKYGLQLPGGLSAGHGAGLVLSRFAAAYEDMGTFDELPTPYRAVATDLNARAEVVFRDGSLFDAVRASMSLPAMFAPVKKNGMLLVDGGVLNNIPVEVVKRMGADVVIAVALDKPPETGRVTSMLGVAGRSLSVMVTANERRSLGLADVVVMPDLDRLGGGDYQKWEEMIRRGRAAAESKSRVLGQFALSEADYAAYVAGRAAKRREERIKPEFIEVEGNVAPKRKQALIAALGSARGAEVNRAELESELTKMTGMGRFDSATYSFARREGKQALVVKTHDKEHGPLLLKMAFLLDASRQEGFRFGIGGRMTWLDFGGPASELRGDLSIGQTNRLSGEYYYRLRGGKWFFAPRLFYWEDSRPLYAGDEQVSDFITRQTGASADFGYAFGRFQEARVGYTVSHDRIAVTKGLNAFDPLKGRYSDLHLKWAYEGQDSALIPRRGFQAWLKGSWVVDHPGVEGKYPMGEAFLGYAKTLNAKYSLLTRLSGGSATAEEALNTTFALGGVGRMDSLGRGRLLGSRYYHGSTHVLRLLNSDSLSLFGKFYLFGAAEAGRAWAKDEQARPRYSGSARLMGETTFGVVDFGVGVGDQGDRRMFFRLGRVF